MATETLQLGTSPRPLDVELVDNGITLEAPMTPGVEYTITPWSNNNRRFRRAMERRFARRALSANGTTAPENLDDEELLEEYEGLRDDPEFVVDAVLRDIDGLLNENGNPVKYTRERGLQVLSDDNWRHLRNWICDQALMLTRRINRATEDDEGN
jgi:hypothetical protein